MNRVKNMSTILALVAILYSFEHKDRISLPKSFVFVFKNKVTIQLSTTDKNLIGKYSSDIVNKKVDLTFAEIIFDYGEKAIFKKTAEKWTSISLADGKEIVSVPATTLDKIPEIHFESIGLLWDGTYKKAFSASYFYLQFDIGNEKSFNKYPQLELLFADKKFKKANLTRQIDKNTSQESQF